MKVLYDAEGDALYIPLRARRTQTARSICVDDRRIVDLDAKGQVIGVEVLAASKGVRLADLRGDFELKLSEEDVRAIEKHWFQPMQYAPPFEG